MRKVKTDRGLRRVLLLSFARSLPAFLVFPRSQSLSTDSGRIAVIELNSGVRLFFSDNNGGSSSDKQQIFSMAGDGSNDDVKIPAVLLFSEEGRILKNAIAALEDTNQRLTVRLASKATGVSGMTGA